MFQIPSEWNAKQRARQENIKQICKGLQVDSSSSVPKGVKLHIYVDDKYRLLYCKTPKVASSTFVAVFLYLAGITESVSINLKTIYGKENLNNRLVTLDKFSESEARWRLSNYTKFFFTRNPVTRLFSAYRNKFTDKENLYYPAKHGTRIIKKYR